MTQMRKDVFAGRWVIMAETATVRPSDFHFKKFVRETTFCPFCETNEALDAIGSLRDSQPGFARERAGLGCAGSTQFRSTITDRRRIGTACRRVPRPDERSGRP